MPKRSTKIPADTLPPKRDTLRLKSDIARGDRNTRALSKMMATADPLTPPSAIKRVQDEQHKIAKKANAQSDTLAMIRKGGGHKSFAQYTEGFDGRAIPGDAGKPPRVEIPRGHPTPDVLPSATGVPGAVVTADGTDNLRSNYRTLEAGSTRATSSTGRGPSLPQHFNDSSV